MSVTKRDLINALKLHAARHYSYRDFHTAATGVAPVTYVFGTNARVISLFNWPRVGDGVMALQCYAREVKVLCTEDTWIAFTSLNPRYATLLAAGYTAAQITALGVPVTLAEVPQFMPADEEITWYPTYGVSVTWYRATADGYIYIWAEGNVEGGE